MQHREHLKGIPRSELAIICLMNSNPPIPDISDSYLDNLCECHIPSVMVVSISYLNCFLHLLNCTANLFRLLYVVCNCSLLNGMNDLYPINVILNPIMIGVVIYFHGSSKTFLQTMSDKIRKIITAHVC